MTRIVPDRLTPEMHTALLNKVSSTDGDGHWIHPDAGYEAAIAASPGQGAVTAAQLEAAAEAAYLNECIRRAPVTDYPLPAWRELAQAARDKRIGDHRAALTALGLTVQP